MATVSYPGVYVEEVSSGVRPITAASTSTAAFLGQAEKGSISEAVRIFNFTEFQNLYGGFLSDGYLAHAVYQYFNNGGAICYIVRVANTDVAVANITLTDQAGAPQDTLAISAVSPGAWGNNLELVVSAGTRDSGNEFNIEIYEGSSASPVEVFENLGMIPGISNYVETVTSTSQYIRVTVDQTNTNAAAGSSTGAAAPSLPLTSPRTRFQVNLNGDGFQEINLQDSVDDATVADLASAANVAAAIQAEVRALTRQRDSTDQNAFTNFTCTVAGTGELVLTCGVVGAASSVNVASSIDGANNCSVLLNLSTLNGGEEIVGGAVTRPHFNGVATAPARYLVGDHATPATGVSSTNTPALGSDGTAVTTDQPYIQALQALNEADDISLVSVPGIGSTNVVGEAMNYCENRSLSDCFFIGDTGQDIDTVDEAQTFVGSISPKNSYGAVYVPWLTMLDPTGVSSEPIAVPPSGFVAGMYAKTDAKRGVWKAPAGTGSALAGATGLVANFTDVQQGLLNPDPYNINVIRQFAASGRVIWGARTISSDAEWRYIPIRRTAMMMRVSIYRGIQWAVFEPNDTELWSQLRLNIGAFMMTLYRQGAFQGSTPSAAFFVKCDSETTTQADIDNGVVNVLVGFAPLKPAEFIVVKISQKAGQSS